MKWQQAACVLGVCGAFSTPCFAWTPEGLIFLARDTVKRAVAHRTLPAVSDEDAAMPVFVTIERRGRVLGCRGSLRPSQSSLQREVVRAARSAAAFDPRFRPLSPADLPEFSVTVTLVKSQTPMAASDIGSLSPEEGLVLQSGERFGIVLPFEGRDPRVRLGWAFKKAGVMRGSPVRLFRLQAERFRG